MNTRFGNKAHVWGYLKHALQHGFRDYLPSRRTISKSPRAEKQVKQYNKHPPPRPIESAGKLFYKKKSLK